MLNENIKVLRKQKGMSQAELAIRLNVVRQTVSKWEKGLSVPDSEMLIQLAEVLETTVSELLGANLSDENGKDEIVEQLVRLNEQFAVRNRRTKTIIKIVLAIIGAIVALQILLIMLASMLSFSGESVREESSSTIVEPVE